MSELYPQYRFETLVVGAANRTAVTAARAVAEAPGRVYNPLFLYAQPGLGKTHLLVALGHEVRAINPRATVAYLTLDEYVDAFHAAIAAGEGDSFRRTYDTLDVLLLDDVQFLGQRREMQQELLRTIDALQAAGRQVVLTSDRPPAEIEALDERLIRRVAGGLIIDIAPPDFETQVAILRRKSEERGLAFGAGVLEAVATLGIGSVRELLGALNRLVAFQAVSDAPLGPDQARVLIGGPAAAAQAPAVALQEPQLAPDPRAGGRTAAAVRSDLGNGVGNGHPPTSPGDALDATLLHKPALAAERDEFGDFLSELAATLSRQVEPWRARVGEAILRWEGEGLRTASLTRLLEQGADDPEAQLIQFEADAERLLEMQREVEDLAPEMAGAPALSDPGNMAAAEAYLQRVREATVPPPGPGAAWLLGDLVESAGNRMALRAAAAIVAAPGTRYNPLVIVGGAGVGKTHLLHGLGNALLASGAGPVACLNAHDFSQELIDAIDRDGVVAWRHRYRRCAALLLDDVHLLAGRERSQEELFLLFNIFAESSRQLGFSAAVPLAQMVGMEARLLTRLEGGLVVELPPPDREMRQLVVERQLAARGLPADPALAAYVASRPAESVRATQGLLQRVLHAAESQSVRPTSELARDVLEGAARAPRRAGTRPGGAMPLAPGGGLRSREKVVLQWPDVADGVIEEWR
ncbi:MAG: DnaA/Hda family protein [Gemmatimonadales bacterium]|nr:DnaA/Hda family protein [Gemmatimonadales bacterium]